MTNGLIDVVMIAAIVLTLNAIILYVVIRLAVTHALRARRVPIDTKAWETWQPKRKGDGGV